MEDFEKLLEDSFRDPEIMGILHEKKAASEERRMSVGEVVKDYPGPQRGIDLHGKTAQEAMFELDHFIGNSIRHRIRTVRIVTGKGLHSRHMQSVLPKATEQKLSELKHDRKVLSFRKEKSGGSYVVYLIS